MKTAGLVKIIHLSDLHFGDDHCFDPERTPAGDRPSRAGWPELAEMLERDLTGDDPGFPVIICISGDVAHTASVVDKEEYERGKALIRHLARTKVFGQVRGKQSIFLVPGNHDVLFKEAELEKRSEHFIGF